ncbi:putative reverse transcriptase zinc-binding domain-containing protein [Helianthus debilis subsp. tardiflorus]
MEWKVGNGEDFAFWLDPWWSEVPFRLKFPNLFLLYMEKKYKVRERIVRPINNPNASWRWKSPPSSNVELAEWSALSNILPDIALSEAPDRWRWLADESGEFNVLSVKRLLDSCSGAGGGFIWEWCRWVALKCNVFAWRAEMERLPTQLEFLKRNIPVVDSCCSMCNEGVETAGHLFTRCSFVAEVWAKVSNWSRTPFLVAFSFKNVLEAHIHYGLKGKKQALFHGIVVITCWFIWKARNDRVFNGKTLKAEEVFRSIMSAGYLWYRNRTKCIDVTWGNWCKLL